VKRILTTVLILAGLTGLAIAQEKDTDQGTDTEFEFRSPGSQPETDSKTSAYPTYGLPRTETPDAGSAPVIGLPTGDDPLATRYPPGAKPVTDSDVDTSTNMGIVAPGTLSAPAEEIRYGTPNTLNRANYPSGTSRSNSNTNPSSNPSQPSGRGSSAYEVRSSPKNTNTRIEPYRNPDAGTKPGVDGIDPYLDPLNQTR
jgi:hypothetical protein